jgi:hypothetical protein
MPLISQPHQTLIQYILPIHFQVQSVSVFFGYLANAMRSFYMSTFDEKVSNP